MMDLPDAQRIRDAETNGMPEAETIYCPVCGAENPDDFVVDEYDQVIGCDCCTKRKDAYDWYIDRKRRGA
jgi:hypothetical protein